MLHTRAFTCYQLFMVWSQFLDWIHFSVWQQQQHLPSNHCCPVQSSFLGTWINEPSHCTSISCEVHCLHLGCFTIVHDLSLSNEVLFSFKLSLSFLKGKTHFVYGLKFMHKQSIVGRCRAQIWQQSDTCSCCLSAYAMYRPTWSSQHVNFTDSESSVWGQIPILNRTFDLCWLLRNIPSIGHHQHRSRYLWTWKTTQKLVHFSLSAIQKPLATFWKLA
jgi:hypothetical protein